ncbi:TIGR04282 family arsenosugar biosynthesis glycosyltransferase [Pontibaca salina]|uniref:TIGR04282 family arsenosugar biosynthesis glycosyltransferase n=1 Tax=Pontibaca salina TaxID=2795731 RepID=A0A934HS01_9RHOB|nr:TIGR04282 family arsenosugar biosynthesis glycosyltransferase [Pontibaca salina]MBI6630692.1 TIGR04282 family arsenosugar biosynthesis glycosyltransferase [Pontibaca salina]
MLKEPRPGRVKTRLGRDIGMIRAAWWFRHQCVRLLREIRDPRWHLLLAVTPDRAGMASRIWPADLARIPQGGGDLGTRMARAMRAAPAGPVCVIGADIPALRRRHVARAFAALGAHDAVFGPARDGGYWLVGLKHSHRVPPSIFADVRWSSPHALSDSMASLPDARIALVDHLRDIDTAADLFADDDTQNPC